MPDVNTLQPVTLPRRVIGKARSQTVTSGRDKDTSFAKDNFHDPNVSMQSLRFFTDAATQLRTLFAVNGMVSSVVVSLVQMAMTDHTLRAYNTGTMDFSPEALVAAEGLVQAWNSVYNYTEGYADKPTMNALKTTMLLECALTGGVGAELVLSQARLPDSLQVFAYDTIIWKAGKNGAKYPSQRAKNVKPGQSTDIELDMPTIFVGEVLKPANVVYNVSFLASGIKQLTMYEEFIDDIRRVVRQSGAPRTVATLNLEKVIQAAPAQIRSNQVQLADYLESTRKQVEDILKDLAPEDALVVYDVAAIEHQGTSGEKKDYATLLDALSGLSASALKSNPAILGLRLGGTQNTSSTESMLFTITAAALHPPVEAVLSRALTLAVRLLGIDAVVEFKFNSIDLRPELELEAHKTMRQTRVLEQLSYGFITDEEAAVELGTGGRPAGAPKLSGTMFLSSAAASGGLDASGSPVSAGSSGVPSDKKDTPLGRAATPSGPAAGGGKDNAKR